jgi:hypothetical protein
VKHATQPLNHSGIREDFPVYPGTELWIILKVFHIIFPTALRGIFT